MKLSFSLEFLTASNWCFLSLKKKNQHSVKFHIAQIIGSHFTHSYELPLVKRAFSFDEGENKRTKKGWVCLSI